MTIYLWIEDHQDKSAHIFWQTFVSVICPYVIVVSKENSSRLVKAVEKLDDRENHYLIVFDHSFDNPSAVRERKKLLEATAGRENVKLIQIHTICFEYILLEFEKLPDWIYAEKDEFRETRKSMLRLREKLIDSINRRTDYKEISELKDYVVHLEQYNIEQLSSRLLYELTRNTGFEVTKSNIGECWIKDCCEYSARRDDDLCGLDLQRLSVDRKMNEIYKGTSLLRELAKAGVEARTV